MRKGYECRVVKHGDYYEIREVRFGPDGIVDSATDRALSPIFGSLTELRDWFEHVSISLEQAAIDFVFLMPVQRMTPTFAKDAEPYSDLETQREKTLQGGKRKTNAVREMLKRLVRGR